MKKNRSSHRFWNTLARYSLFAVLLVGVFFFMSDPAFAQVNTSDNGGIALGARSPFEIISAVINIFLGFLTFVALGIIMYGGWMWMTAAGNEDKIAQAKKILINGTIGLVIILASWGITLWILRAIADATGTDLAGDGTDRCAGCSIPGGGGSNFRVVSTTPENNATDVLLCTDVTVRMSGPVDKSTVTAENFSLTVLDGKPAGSNCSANKECASATCDAGSQQCVGDTIPGTIGFAPGDASEYFNIVPSKTFDQDTTYRAQVRGGSGGVLSADPTPADTTDDRSSLSQSYQWTFETGQDTDTTPPQVVVSESSPFPGPKSEDICLNTVINFNFNEAMRITSFNDDTSFVLDTAASGPADWLDPVALDGWSFGSLLTYAQARPAAALEKNTQYATRLFAGDANNNFAGAITDSCGNALDGNANGQSEGSITDNFTPTPAGSSEKQTVWMTGENPLCTPVIESIDPNVDVYGEFTPDAAGSTLRITGKYLGPNPEVEFQGDNGRTILAAEGVNSCFDAAHIGALDQDTSKGDYCADAPNLGISALQLRTPVTTTDSRPIVRVAGESSEPAPENVDSISPHISGMDPQSGAPGQYITMRGENFGTDNGTVLLKSLDGSRTSELSLPAADVCGDTWDATQIIAVAPETYRDANGAQGTWATGDVAYIQVRRRDGKHSDLMQFTFSDEQRPNVCRIEPQCSDVGEASFQLSGDRFGEQQNSQRVMFTKLSDAATGYSAGITGWNPTRISGNTSAAMGQDTYWASVYDEATKTSSNGVEYRIPCAPAPHVVEINSCDAQNNIFPSPNPVPNATDACVNAQFGLLFDQEMDGNSFNASSVTFEQFNTGDTLNESYPKFQMSDGNNSPMGGFPAVEPWKVEMGENTYYGIQFQMTRTPLDTNQDGVSDGSSGYLQPNTWYRVTVTSGVKSAAGIPLASPYTFQFKTRDSAESCAISSVDVAPPEATKNTYLGDPENGRQSYQSFVASAYDAECRLLSSRDYNWNWTTSNGRVGAFGPERPFTATENVYVPGARAENEGSATITATTEGLSDAATFSVDFGACTQDSDCNACGVGASQCNETIGRCTPVISDFTPKDGDNGTWATINGCYFGGEKGSINWKSESGVAADTEWPNPDQCGASTWSDTQIVAEVPTLYDSDGDGTRDASVGDGKYSISLKTADNAEAASSSLFTVNQTVRPGLCRIEPDQGEVSASVRAYGQNLGTDKGAATFLSEDDYNKDGKPDRIPARDAQTEWSQTEIATVVPTGAWSDDSGKDGFRATAAGGDVQCTDASKCTNPVNFVVRCSADSDCGSGICGESGICEAVNDANTCSVDADCQKACPGTATRCDNNKCTPVIKEVSPASAPSGATVSVLGCFFDGYGENSGVQFNATEANLACVDGWSNDRIEAIVPDASAIGDRSVVRVRRDDGVVTNDVSFSRVDQCPGGEPVPANGMPSLCEVYPASGFVGEQVSFIGNNFTQSAKAQFPGLRTGSGGSAPFVEQSQIRFVDSTQISTLVPDGAQTGEAAVSVNACVSNTQHFNVLCNTADDCGNGSYCVNGICTDPSIDQCAVCTPGTAAQICGGAAGCTYNQEMGQGCCSERPSITGSSIRNQQEDVCPNTAITVDFSEAMTGFQFAKLQKKVGDSYQDVATTKSFNNNQLQMNVTGRGLQTSTEYKIVLPSDDQDAASVRSDKTLLALLGGRGSIQFRTADSLCVPDAVSLKNSTTGDDLSMYTFTAQDQTLPVDAVATANGQEIVPNDQVNWEYIWTPYQDANRCDNVAWIDGEQSLGASLSSQIVRSGDQNNGTSSVSVQLSPTAGWTNQNVRDTANVQTFFCEPDKLWQYMDDPGFSATLANQHAYQSHANPQYFDIIYCMNDSKPALNPPVITEGGPNDKWFLQYLFMNPVNLKEAFAVRVFSNAENLSPEEWYRKNAPSPGSANTLTIDGYQAIQDGNSYYVSASNVIPGANGGEKQLYNNIYLITFNDGVEKAEAVGALRSEILQYLHFNTNVDMAQCTGSDKAKLTRDTKRVSDLGTIASLANDYYQSNRAYPAPKSQSFGSYIANFTTSMWNSWQGALGNTLGSTLPTDPLNLFYARSTPDPYNATENSWVSTAEDPVRDCKYDPNTGKYFDESGTCWDPVNSKFFCPEYSSVYAYKKTDDQTVSLYAHLEYGQFFAGGQSETYIDQANVQRSDNVCSDLTNAECACFNYGITSRNPGNQFTPIQ